MSNNSSINKIKFDPTKPFSNTKVNFNLSGKLALDTNLVNGVLLNYTEPAEASLPTKKWRLYPFSNDKSLPTIELNKKSFFLFGRNRDVVDILNNNLSCSRQHAVIQFRKVPSKKNENKYEVRPYLIDLGSENGTFLNNNRIDSMKYYELLEKDVIKIGSSRTDYVVLTDESD